MHGAPVIPDHLETALRDWIDSLTTALLFGSPTDGCGRSIHMICFRYDPAHADFAYQFAYQIETLNDGRPLLDADRGRPSPASRRSSCAGSARSDGTPLHHPGAGPGCGRHRRARTAGGKGDRVQRSPRGQRIGPKLRPPARPTPCALPSAPSTASPGPIASPGRRPRGLAQRADAKAGRCKSRHSCCIGTTRGEAIPAVSLPSATSAVGVRPGTNALKLAAVAGSSPVAERLGWGRGCVGSGKPHPILPANRRGTDTARGWPV